MNSSRIAHRGYAARYPENTIIGIEAAIKAGAGFVEVDVQLAADGTPMLFHDRTLNRMCGIDGGIADYSPQQLAQFSAAEPARFGNTFAGTPIATLKALSGLMRRHPQVHFFIELKCESIERFDAVMLLERTQQLLMGLGGMFTLISFSIEIVEMAKKQGVSSGLILENWPQEKKREISPLFSAPFFLFCNIKRLPASGQLHIPGAKLAIYEVADPAQARQLSARGVDFVETFAIEEMLAVLAKD